MLMSKSRLEKFLYALYSLDYSDLPTPLSRIEELYNCLVTGAEAPTFEPLSRVEKYLMAILGVYGADSLPLPLSRVEILLYKLATGDDNLDDIESFLSRHEELLAEIEVAKYIPYMTYELTEKETTLYNTKEYSVKSAVLTGQTLVNFEGMQSVENPVVTTTGKNLFDVNGKFITAGATTHSINDDSLTITGNWFARQVIDLKPNTLYTLSYEKAESDNGFVKMAVFINNASINVATSNTNMLTFRTPGNFEDISVIFYAKEGGDANTVTYTNIQLEEGSVATEYKPYKSTTVTCNEEVELRGIGDVKDGLDLVTGEVTRRITEVVLDGSEDWGLMYYSANNNKRYIMNGVTFPFTNYREISDSFATGKSFWAIDETGMYIGTNGRLVIVFQTTDNRYKYTIDEFKKYLSENPVKLQYIIEESVESTSLTVKDQDGNNTKLKTFEDITYVTLSSEGLIPEAELEVATKNEEVLNALSLEMDDISTAQTTLEETSNAQSENVDSTMLATTEIYEGLL